MPAKEGNDWRSRAGERAVGAVGLNATRGWLEGVVHSTGSLYHTAVATAPLPPQSLPLRRVLCSPGIELSQRSQLSREGSTCGGVRRRRASRWGGGRDAAPLPQSRAANG